MNSKCSNAASGTNIPASPTTFCKAPCVCVPACEQQRFTEPRAREPHADPLHMTAARHKHCNVQLIAHNSCETRAHKSMSTHTQTHCLPQITALAACAAVAGKLGSSACTLAALCQRRRRKCLSSDTHTTSACASKRYARNALLLPAVMPGAATSAMLHISRRAGCCCRSSSTTAQRHEQRDSPHC